MKKLSGWQKVGLFAGIGCFSFVALLVVGFAIAVFYAKSTVAGLGDTTPARVERKIEILAPTAEAATAEAPPPGTKSAEATATGPMQLHVELQEGSFDIKPGEPNGRVRVEGEFSEALYELTQSTDAANGKPRTTIRFRSKAPAWARMLAGIGNGRSDQPRLMLLIPPAVPIDPVEELHTQNDARDVHIDARTSMPIWLGERLDVVWAIDVLHPLACRPSVKA